MKQTHLRPGSERGPVWAHVRRAHTPDLDDIPMESNY
jgi:hypothetical protein